MAEEVVAGDVERAEEVGELREEEGGRPEGGVTFAGGEARRFAAADLIVHEDGDGEVVREEGDWEEIVVDYAGAAVQADERGRGRGEGAPEGVVGFAEVAGRGDLEEDGAGFGWWWGAALLPRWGRKFPFVHGSGEGGRGLMMIAMTVTMVIMVTMVMMAMMVMITKVVGSCSSYDLNAMIYILGKLRSDRESDAVRWAHPMKMTVIWSLPLC